MYTLDGNRIAFMRRQALTMKPDGAITKVLIDQQQVFDYDWSPTGRDRLFASDGSFSEMYIMPVDGRSPVNVTHYATFNADVSWGGNKIGSSASAQWYGRARACCQARNWRDSRAPATSIDDIHLSQ